MQNSKCKRARHSGGVCILHFELPVPLISVAVPVPFLDLLTYNVPAQLPMPAIGARVRVPVGTRTVTGCVVESPAAAVTTAVDVRDVLEIVDEDSFLPPAIVELCQWVADYYV